MSDTFDPEFDSGCSTCDKEHSMADMYYDPETGEHTCQLCHDSVAFDRAMDMLKPEIPC